MILVLIHSTKTLGVNYQDILENNKCFIYKIFNFYFIIPYHLCNLDFNFFENFYKATTPEKITCILK